MSDFCWVLPVLSTGVPSWFWDFARYSSVRNGEEATSLLGVYASVIARYVFALRIIFVDM